MQRLSALPRSSQITKEQGDIAWRLLQGEPRKDVKGVPPGF